MTKVFLVRHGTTDWNETKRAQGQADIELNQEGWAQAEKTAESFTGHGITAVYSSDLRRAADTAQAIAARQNLEVHLDRAFREIDQGEWTGLTTDQIKLRWPERWVQERHNTRRPGGESPQQVRARALEGLKRVVGMHPEATVVIVGHGVTIRCISAEALGYEDSRSGRVRGVSNGGVVSFDARITDGRLVLSGFQRLDGKTPALDDPNV